MSAICLLFVRFLVTSDIQVLLYEGHDDYEHIAVYAKHTIEELEDLAKNGMWLDIEGEDGTIESHRVSITALEGGDLKYLNGTCGLSGCSADCSCPWCLVTNAEHATCKSPTMRTSDFMLKMAHAVIPGVLEAGYTCPCCHKVSHHLLMLLADVAVVVADQHTV